LALSFQSKSLIQSTKSVTLKLADLETRFAASLKRLEELDSLARVARIDPVSCIAALKAHISEGSLDVAVHECGLERSARMRVMSPVIRRLKEERMQLTARRKRSGRNPSDSSSFIGDGISASIFDDSPCTSDELPGVATSRSSTNSIRSQSSADVRRAMAIAAAGGTRVFVDHDGSRTVRFETPSPSDSISVPINTESNVYKLSDQKTYSGTRDSVDINKEVLKDGVTSTSQSQWMEMAQQRYTGQNQRETAQSAPPHGVVGDIYIAHSPMEYVLIEPRRDEGARCMGSAHGINSQLAQSSDLREGLNTQQPTPALPPLVKGNHAGSPSVSKRLAGAAERAERARANRMAAAAAAAGAIKSLRRLKQVSSDENYTSPT
jgi:hypothetical protein